MIPEIVGMFAFGVGIGVFLAFWPAFFSAIFRIVRGR